MSRAKSFAIPKGLVWKAWLQVRSNRGAPGLDDQTVEAFEGNLKNNLYKIWNRMASGTYFPPPVLQVAIPKRGGSERILGIPTVADRVAQTAVALYLEPIVEASFHEDSYGYRPRRSAHDALARARARCWKFDWVLDLDIRAFFDSLEHDLVLRAVRRFTNCRWVLLYVERWLRASARTPEGLIVQRERGTPQGGAISPVLANMFLHLAFDGWMQRFHPTTPFERYADDVVVHCSTREQAEMLLAAIEARLARCKLQLHPQKTKIVYCKDSNRLGRVPETSFDFLGHTFRPRRARNHRGRLFVSFSPAISPEATKRIRQEIRRNWRLPRRTDKELEDLARMFDAQLRGWIGYYGRFHRSALYGVFRFLDDALVRWVTRKYKRFRGHWTRASKWLQAVRKRSPGLWAHWRLIPSESTAG